MDKQTNTGSHRHRLSALVFVFVTVVLLASVAVGPVAAQEDVSNADDLKDIRNDLDGDYVLTDDIDLSGTENLEPIGVEMNPFTGTFDGNGHNITGLTIERLDDKGVGLFGDTGTGAVVRNVTMKDVSVDGEQWVGALVGFNKGEVSEAHATGTVVADTRAGGLVGGNEGLITESSARGDMTAADIVGGLVGSNIGTVSQSYANASVAGFEGTTARDMGGLVGVNAGDIEDSYARGKVIGDRYLGGLVGASKGDIVGSYSTAEVDGDSETGGLVGDFNYDGSGATLRDSYWDEQATTRTDAVGAQTGTPTVDDIVGLQTSEMLGEEAETNMDEFDFATTWATVTDPDEYPVLAWQVDADDAAPADFKVTVDGTNSPVREGETLTVDVTAENTGGESDTQTLSLTVGGTERDPKDITLNGGETTTETLQWTTGEGDAGDYTLTVESENDTDTASVTVKDTPGANFEVTIDGTNSPVTEGETLTVDVTAENTGDGSGTQTVSLSVGGTERDSLELTLSGGDTSSGTLTWTTEKGDGGSYTATVESENDTDTAAVTVESDGGGGVESSPVDGVSDELWIAVTADDGDVGNLSLSDLGNAIQEYQANPSDADVDGAPITLGDLGSLIQYYRNVVV